MNYLLETTGSAAITPFVSQGAKANLTGKELESYVEKLLLDKGYITIPRQEKKELLLNKNNYETKLYGRNVNCGEGIYRTKKRKCDFFLVNKEVFPEGLVIECRWQQSPGSVDEKFPYMLKCIEKLKIPTVIVADGGGASSGALEWLYDNVEISEIQIKVCDIIKFEELIFSNYFG